MAPISLIPTSLCDTYYSNSKNPHTSQLLSFTHSLYYLSTTQLTLICWITGFISHSGFGFQLCTFLYHVLLHFTFCLSTAQALTTDLEGLEASDTLI